jgi:hypothetical protein
MGRRSRLGVSVSAVVDRAPRATSSSVRDWYGFWPIEWTFSRKNRSRMVEFPTTTIS